MSAVVSSVLLPSPPPSSIFDFLQAAMTQAREVYLRSEREYVEGCVMAALDFGFTPSKESKRSATKRLSQRGVAEPVRESRARLREREIDRAERESMRAAVISLNDPDDRASLIAAIVEYAETLTELATGQRAIVLAAVVQNVDSGRLSNVFGPGAPNLRFVLASLPMGERLVLHATTAVHRSDADGAVRLGLHEADVERLRKAGLYRLALRLGLVDGEEPVQ